MMMSLLLAGIGMFLMSWMGWQFLLLLARFFVDISDGSILGDIVKWVYMGMFFWASLTTLLMFVAVPYFLFFPSYIYYRYGIGFFEGAMILGLMYALPMHFLRFVQATLSLIQGRFAETLPGQVLAYRRSILGALWRTLTPSFAPDVLDTSAKAAAKPKRKVEELKQDSEAAAGQKRKRAVTEWAASSIDFSERETSDSDVKTLAELLAEQAQRHQTKR